MFNHVPFGIVFIVDCIIINCIIFITSADSATFVLGMQTTFGSLNPSSMVKVVWGISGLNSICTFISWWGNGAEALNAIQCALYRCIPILHCRHTHDGKVSTLMQTRNVIS